MWTVSICGFLEGKGRVLLGMEEKHSGTSCSMDAAAGAVQRRRMTECCETCNKCLDLVRYNYGRDGGCDHRIQPGFICLAFADEGQAIWMTGIKRETGMCECYSPKEKKCID